MVTLSLDSALRVDERSSKAARACTPCGACPVMHWRQAESGQIPFALGPIQSRR